MGDGNTDRPDKLIDSHGGVQKTESERNAIIQEKKEHEEKRDLRIIEMWKRMQRDSWNHMNEIYKRRK